MRTLFLSALILVLLSACRQVPEGGSGPVVTPGPDEPVSNETPNPPAEDPYAPQPGDLDLMSGPVYLDSVELLTLESYPLQFTLALAGSLPTPCHQLRVDVRTPDAQNRIEVRVYAVADPNAVCIQVLEPFDVNIGLGSFPAGHYILMVNGETITEFDV
jgi:hypothetical protein